MKFITPAIFNRGWKLRTQTIFVLILIVVNKCLNVTHPMILKYAVDEISVGALAIWLLVAYGSVRFFTELVYNINQIIFANVSAACEVYIADLVYNHV